MPYGVFTAMGHSKAAGRATVPRFGGADSVTLTEKRAEEDSTQPELQEASVDTGSASECGGGCGEVPSESNSQ
jgi:hypothetical protein